MFKNFDYFSLKKWNKINRDLFTPNLIFLRLKIKFHTLNIFYNPEYHADIIHVFAFFYNIFQTMEIFLLFITMVQNSLINYFIVFIFIRGTCNSACLLWRFSSNHFIGSDDILNLLPFILWLTNHLLIVI